MVNRFGGVRPVFVDDGKRGAVNRIRNAQFFTDRLDKSGFAGSHFSVEGKNRTVAHPTNKFFRRFADDFHVFYLNEVHLKFLLADKSKQNIVPVKMFAIFAIHIH
jgi:hypothetical protein